MYVTSYLKKKKNVLKLPEKIWISLRSATSTVWGVHHRHADTVNTDILDIFKNMCRHVPCFFAAPSYLDVYTEPVYRPFWAFWALLAWERFSPLLLLYLTLGGGGIGEGGSLSIDGGFLENGYMFDENTQPPTQRHSFLSASTANHMQCI